MIWVTIIGMNPTKKKVTFETLPDLQLEATAGWDDYELLDSGNGLKLERYGVFRLARPEAEAIWRPAFPESEWQAADAVFKPGAEEQGGNWTMRTQLPDEWMMGYGGLRFAVQASGSRHVGVFPEQAPYWDWIALQVEAAGRPIEALNLFGYTGLATLAAARSGAKVTHVDASRKAIQWAKHNQSLSGLEDAPVRWMVDDALKFVQREARRGRKYEGLILDPPKFGRGPKGQVWEFYKLLPDLLQACGEILSPDLQFVALTAYAVKASPRTLQQALAEMLEPHVSSGRLEAGELALRESSGSRLLPMAVFARWGAGTTRHAS